MFHQVVHIGEERIPAVIEYSEDECGPLVIDKITIINGPVIPVGAYPESYLDKLADKLADNHDRVLAELRSMYHADRAADNDAFREACA